MGVTGRSSGSGAVRAGAITGAEPRDGDAMVFGGGSSARWSEGAGGATLGEPASAGDGDALPLGASVSSPEGAPRPLAGDTPAGDGPAAAGTPSGAASAAGTSSPAEGDHT